MNWSLVQSKPLPFQIKMFMQYIEIDATAGTMTADWYPVAFNCNDLPVEEVVNIYFDQYAATSLLQAQRHSSLTLATSLEDLRLLLNLTTSWVLLIDRLFSPPFNSTQQTTASSKSIYCIVVFQHSGPSASWSTRKLTPSPGCQDPPCSGIPWTRRSF